MVLEPFFGPWPLFFQVRNPVISLQDFLAEGSAFRKVVTYTRDNTNIE
jgi:hypothetical protein